MCLLALYHCCDFHQTLFHVRSYLVCITQLPRAKQPLLHQHATAISGSGCGSSDSATIGLFWNSFLSCPHAALASSPRVCRTLEVTLRDSRAAANACICPTIQS